MVVFNINISVGPHYTPPLTPAGTHEGFFPVLPVNIPSLSIGLPGAFFLANSKLTIGPATGTIGSGVIFTFPNGPRGWDGWSADSDDWPYNRQIDSVRFSLIGALIEHEGEPNHDEWFYIGENIVPKIALSTDNPKFLWLACNRPAANGLLSSGDGFWQVPVLFEVFAEVPLPDCATPPTTRSPRCLQAVRNLTDISSRFPHFCDGVREVRRVTSDRGGALIVLVSVLVGELTIIGAFLIGAAVIHGVASSAALHTIVLIAGVSGGVVLGVTSAALVSAVTDLGVALGTVATVTTGLLAAGAGAGFAALCGNPWSCLAYGILVAAGIATLIAVEAVGANQLHDLQLLDADNRQLSNMLGQWDNALSIAQAECCASVLTNMETTRPACS